MNGKKMRMFKNPRLVSLSVLVIGLILVVVSLQLPRPVIVDGEDTTFGLWTRLFDLGNGLASFSLSMLVFLFIAKVKRWSDFRLIKALERGWLILISVSSAVLAFPSSFWYFTMRAQRGDYPPNHDTLAIPLAGAAVGNFILLVFVTVLVIFVSQNCVLPVTIGLNPVKKSKIRFASVMFWMFVGVMAVILICDIIDGNQLDIPRMMAYLYVAFAIRAGKVNCERL